MKLVYVDTGERFLRHQFEVCKLKRFNWMKFFAAPAPTYPSDSQLVKLISSQINDKAKNEDSIWRDARKVSTKGRSFVDVVFLFEKLVGASSGGTQSHGDYF